MGPALWGLPSWWKKIEVCSSNCHVASDSKPRDKGAEKVLRERVTSLWRTLGELLREGVSWDLKDEENFNSRIGKKDFPSGKRSLSGSLESGALLTLEKGESFEWVWPGQVETEKFWKHLIWTGLRAEECPLDCLQSSVENQGRFWSSGPAESELAFRSSASGGPGEGGRPARGSRPPGRRRWGPRLGWEAWKQKMLGMPLKKRYFFLL